MRRESSLLRVLRLRESVARVEDDQARQMLDREIDRLADLQARQEALDVQRAQRAKAERLDVGLSRALDDIDRALGDAQRSASAEVEQAERARSATSDSLIAASRGLRRARHRHDAFERLLERDRELRHMDDDMRRRPR